MHLLISYSPRFSLALALWPLASLVLTLPILALLYHRDGRLRLWSAVGSYIAVFYLLGLVCFTLYPLPSGTSGLGITRGATPQLDPWRFVADIKSGSKSAIFQLAANVALFVPFGFIAGRGLGWGPVRCVLAGFATSLLIETTQLTGIWGHYAYAYRTFDVDDLLTNTVGAFAGWACAAVLGLFFPHRIDPEALEPTHEPKLIRRVVAFVLDMAIIWAASIAFIAVAQFALRHYFADWGHYERLMDLTSRWSLRAMFVLCELFVPFAWRGKTLGGSFVRMSVETKPRRGALRLVFFLARFAVLCLVWREPFWSLLGLGAFWLVFRRMPHDLIPASAPREGLERAPREG